MQSGCQRSWLIGSLLCMAIVLVLTHIPGEVMPRMLQEHMMDKVEHVSAYGLIAILFLLSLRHPVRLSVLSVGLLLLAGVGILDELTQPFFHRTASIRDYAADLTGIALACVIFFVSRRPRSGVMIS